jgi:threonine/homoserine/homoserine lactone efflux protein
MFTELLFTFIMLLLLGVFHGVNPGMGWLFAVSLGLQEQRRAAVWSALLPLALGHALAIGTTLLGVGIIGLVIPFDILKWFVAFILVTFGIYKLIRNRHPRYGGMQVNFRQLTIWSFLMATAHGAGLMVLPFLFSNTGGTMHDAGMHEHPGPMTSEVVAHASHANILSHLPGEPAIGLIVILVHTLGYLLIMGIVAVIVYEKLGLRLLKSAWFNIDLIWAAALILSGVLVPLI